MTVYQLGPAKPRLPESGDFWIAPDASVIGDVELGDEASIWFCAVLRGDNAAITVGARSNIQDHAMVHADPGLPVRIGADVTVGHRAIVHGCSIGDGSLVGMGAIVLNGAKVGRGCLIGAGALVTEGKEIPDGSVVLGSPGRVARVLDAAGQAELLKSSAHYVQTWQRFATGLRR